MRSLYKIVTNLEEPSSGVSRTGVGIAPRSSLLVFDELMKEEGKIATIARMADWHEDSISRFVLPSDRPRRPLYTPLPLAILYP